VVVAGFFSVVAECVLRSENHLLIQHFGLAYEQNVPTWYISSLLLLCAGVLALIATSKQKKRQPYVMHWWILAFAFLFISCDETATIHELSSGWFNLHGIFYYGWVIPGSLVVVGMGLLFLTFLGHLPRRTRVRFVVAGFIYVTGALCLDMVCAYLDERSGTDTILYGMFDLIEESLEILGITLFLLALLDYVNPQADALRLSIHAARRGDRPTRSEESGGEKPEFSTAAVCLLANDIAAEAPVDVAVGSQQ
jgi:hypothetical protein